MGAAGTSDARKTDNMRKEVIAFDGYNFCVGGDITTALRASRADEQHIPCVLIKGTVTYELSESDRASDGEQPSRELLRTGRIQ